MKKFETVFQKWPQERRKRNLAQWKKWGPAILELMERIEKLEAR